MYRLPIYDNELFYGYFGRYSLNTLLSLNKTKEHFFGGYDFGISLLFPTKPALLISRHLFSKKEVEELMQHHTLLWYFKSFVSSDRWDNIIDQLLNRTIEGWSVENYLGFNRQGIDLKIPPKYCSLCIREQLKALNEFYFNRFHQIPNILICVKHKCYLSDCVPETNSQTKYPFYRPILESCPLLEPIYNHSETTFELAKLAIEIAKGNHQIDVDYINRARLVGYISGISRMDRLKLSDDFNRFYGLKMNDKLSFSDTLLENKKIINPYRNLMLDHFLRIKEATVSERSKHEGLFLKTKFWDQNYFGKGPWRCLNENCKWYGQDVVEDVKFNYHYKARRTVGYFFCKCGDIYSMANQIENGRIIRTKIKEQFSLDFGFEKDEKASRLKKLLLAKRGKWQHYKANKKIKESDRPKLKKLTRWLKDNDSKWISNKIKSIGQVKLKLKIIEVKRIFASFKKDPPTEQITRTTILKKAGMSITIMHDPQIEKLISSGVESFDDFRIRRLIRTAMKLNSDGRNMTFSMLTSEANIRKKISKKVRKAANELLKKYF